MNTTLSAILTFSDHVLYQPYLQAPRLFGTTALSDQSCAGVLMWVPGSLVFLVPAALIAMQYLSASHRLVRPQMLQRGTAATESAKRSGVREGASKERGSVEQQSVSSVPASYVTLSSHALDAPLRPTRTRRRFDLLSVPLVGPFLRAQSGRRFLQATLFIIALAVIVDGLFGPQVSSANLAGVLPWTYWRALVVIGLLAAGNVFCMACPFMLFRELGRRLGLRQTSLAACFALKMVRRRVARFVLLGLRGLRPVG